ncbi:MAG TPA: SBBP repeat-containing protein [Terriglobia bacterium]|nr:SBBP repeat-containing protein [Terriglobia bacterium]
MEPKQVRGRRAVSLILGMVLALSVFSPFAFAQTDPVLPFSQAAGLKLPIAKPAAPDAATRARVIDTYGKLPLRFEANRGQTDSRVKFLARGAGYSLFLTGDEAVLSLRQAEAGKQKAAGRGDIPNSKTATRHLALVTARPSVTAQSVVRMKLVGANSQATVTGLAELPGKSNYFIGNDPKKWRTDVPNYCQVRYQNAYPGIDLVYYGNQGQLEYDFVVAPGADPRAITLDVGAGLAPPTIAAVSDRRPAVRTPPLQPRAQQAPPLRIATNGDLVLRLNGGEIRFHKPVVYQDADTDLIPALAPAPLTHRYAVPPLPASGERAGVRGLAPLRRYLDGHYVLKGHLVNFAVASYDHSRPLVIDPMLSYSGYLGGSQEDYDYGIALDGSGGVYVAGWTDSADFPIVNQIPGACNGACGSGPPVLTIFLTKLNIVGDAVVYSTFIGGSFSNAAFAVAVDHSGDAYLTGWTNSADFPIVNQIPGACIGTCGTGANDNAFVAEVSAAGSELVFSSLIGGSGGLDGFAELGAGVAVDASGNVYLTGNTISPDFPRLNQIPGACNGSCGAGVHYDAFVTKVSPTGSVLVYSSLIGGSGGGSQSYEGDAGEGIAVDSSGNVYLTGGTFSPDFPIVDQIIGACNGTCGDGHYGAGFVIKVNSAGSALAYSSYIGGSGGDTGLSIALDGTGDAYLTGATGSSDFPRVGQIPGACNGTCGSGYPLTNAFVTKVNASGNALVYSSLVGGSGGSEGYGEAGASITVDGSGAAYLTGYTTSADFPRLNQIPGACNGSCGTGVHFDAFVTKINAAASALLYSSYLGGSSDQQSFGIAVDSASNAYLAGVTYSPDFPRVNQIPGACRGTCSTGNNLDSFVVEISPSPFVTFSPASLTFGPQGAQAPNVPGIVTLTSTGEFPVVISNIDFTGPNWANFTQTNNCPFSPNQIQPGDFCTITVVFTPGGNGTLIANLSVTDNAAGSPQNVPITAAEVSGKPGLAGPKGRR